MMEMLSENIDGYEFERFISDLWRIKGWNTEVTESSGDMGVDVIGKKEFPFEETVLIQTKCYSQENKVSSPEMQKYASLKQRRGVDKVIIITTSKFTNQAIALAEDYNLKLIDGEKLNELIRQLEAEELVESYAEGSEVEIASVNETSNNEKSRKAPQSHISEGNWLEIEVTSFGHVTGEVTLSEIREERLEIDGYLACLNVYNKSDNSWSFMSNNPDSNMGLSIFDEDGFTYKAHYTGRGDTAMGYVELPHNWEGGKTLIPSGRKVKMVAYFPSSKNTNPAGIEYEETAWHATNLDKYTPVKEYQENIRIRLSRKGKEKIEGLPESIQSSING